MHLQQNITFVGMLRSTLSVTHSLQAELCPVIHGESGLDGPNGGALLKHTGRSPLPHKAVPYMFDRIAAEHAVRCGSLTTHYIACVHQRPLN